MIFLLKPAFHSSAGMNFTPVQLHPNLSPINSGGTYLELKNKRLGDVLNGAAIDLVVLCLPTRLVKKRPLLG